MREHEVHPRVFRPYGDCYVPGQLKNALTCRTDKNRWFSCPHGNIQAMRVNARWNIQR